MTAFWWLAAFAAACLGLYIAIRVRTAISCDRDRVSPELGEEIAFRADEQNRWAQRGDARGVYGVEGAELMRRVDPQPNIAADLEKAADYPKTAAITYTRADLRTLLAEKLPGWRWAAFASVLVQRRAEVQSRLRDHQLGYGAPSGEHAHTGLEVGQFVIDRMDEFGVLIGQVDSFMATPAFVGVFGDPGDESSADADGIVHTANRLMDYHERLLSLVERCRGLAVSSDYTQLVGDLTRFIDASVVAYRNFIDDFVERVGEMPAMLRYARGVVKLDPVVLHMEVDDELVKRISRQLSAIAAH
jgi:hypothetical protein